LIIVQITLYAYAIPANVFKPATYVIPADVTLLCTYELDAPLDKPAAYAIPADVTLLSLYVLDPLHILLPMQLPLTG
jgi:hypothetical protein